MQMTLVDKNLKQNKKFLLNVKILVEKKKGSFWIYSERHMLQV